MPRKPPTHRPPGFEQARRDARRMSDRVRDRDEYRRLLWTPHYRRFSRLIRLQRPVCEDCNRAESKHVHHVRRLRDHPEDLTDPEQVKALCHECHSVRTRRGE